MRRPEFQMEDRLLLDKVNYEDGTITIGGKSYKMRDVEFPTVDPKNPYALSPEGRSQYGNFCCLSQIPSGFL
mgnify:CR=1 FL=1